MDYVMRRRSTVGGALEMFSLPLPFGERKSPSRYYSTSNNPALLQWRTSNCRQRCRCSCRRTRCRSSFRSCTPISCCTCCSTCCSCTCCSQHHFSILKHNQQQSQFAPYYLESLIHNHYALTESTRHDNLTKLLKCYFKISTAVSLQDCDVG